MEEIKKSLEKALDRYVGNHAIGRKFLIEVVEEFVVDNKYSEKLLKEGITIMDDYFVKKGYTLSEHDHYLKN